MLYKSNVMVIGFCLLFMFGCSTVTTVNNNDVVYDQTKVKLPVRFKKITDERFSIALGKLLSSKKMHLGQELNAKDQKILGGVAVRLLDDSVESGVATWENVDTGHKGVFKLLKTEGYSDQQLVCQSFIHTLIVDSRKEKFNGMACRDMWTPKANWYLYKV